MAIDNIPNSRAVGSKKKPNEGVIQQILKFAAGLLPAKLVRALDIILHPCCDYQLTVKKVTCDGTNTYSIDLELDKPINVHGGGIFYFTIDSYIMAFNEATLGNSLGTWNDTATRIHLTGLHTPMFDDLSGPHTVGINVIMPMTLGTPTSYKDFSPAILIQAIGDEVTFPVCP